MKALRFHYSVPRYLSTLILGKVSPFFYTGPTSPLRYEEIPEPVPPGPDWVVVRTRLAGICGSDINMVKLHDSPSASPYASYPFVLGHENVGEVHIAGEACDLAPGTRVVVDPLLPCRTRGIEPVCQRCSEGNTSQCEHFIDGVLSPGLLLGACRDTGGSFSEYYLAHVSQVIPLPDSVSDEEAVLLDAFASALHPVLRHRPGNNDTVLVIGAGVIGQCVIAAIRALSVKCRTIVLAKYGYQERMAKHFGADEVIRSTRDLDTLFAQVAVATGGRVLKPIVGRPVLHGGADVVFECVGNDLTLDLALRFARSGGKVCLVGLASQAQGVDWTPVWLNELTIAGSFAYGDEVRAGERTSTYRWGLDMIAEGAVRLSPLLTHRFPLSKYREAFALLQSKAGQEVFKCAFSFREEDKN
ncbi:MAG: alcohol dehydrogenase catalytic domain-containing protein [Bacillota bacterium]